MKALHGIRVQNVDVTRPEADAAFGVQKFWHDPRDTTTPPASPIFW